MIAAQEELDWECYRRYGLIDEDLTASSTVDAPALAVGERAFEMVLARQGAAPAWFARHGAAPITEPPAHWPEEYRTLVARRIAVIASDRNIGLVERPEYKRPWTGEGWDGLTRAALREWLLDRLEAPELWAGSTVLSLAQLADIVAADEDVRSALELWSIAAEPGVAKALLDLLKDEHVPYLASLRHKPSGLAKRTAWETIWQAQRAGTQSTAEAPPKYVAADYLRPSYWRHRGRLDVPTERFISYPGLAREDDATLMIGWAGWNHAARAQALLELYNDMRGRDREQLLALLAGLAELEPWLEGSPAERVTSLINAELATLGADRDQLSRRQT
jgi:hypothetical protein